MDFGKLLFLAVGVGSIAYIYKQSHNPESNDDAPDDSDSAESDASAEIARLNEEIQALKSQLIETDENSTVAEKAAAMSKNAEILGKMNKLAREVLVLAGG